MGEDRGGVLLDGANGGSYPQQNLPHPFLSQYYWQRLRKKINKSFLWNSLQWKWCFAFLSVFLIMEDINKDNQD